MASPTTSMFPAAMQIFLARMKDRLGQGGFPRLFQEATLPSMAKVSEQTFCVTEVLAAKWHDGAGGFFAAGHASSMPQMADRPCRPHGWMLELGLPFLQSPKNKDRRGILGFPYCLPAALLFFFNSAGKLALPSIDGMLNATV